MHLLHFVSDQFNEYNSSNFRVTIIATALRNAGHKVTILPIKDWLTQSSRGKLACSLADIIIIQRVMVQESVQHAQMWIQNGKKVILDFDDAYDLIGEENSAYNFWGKGIVEIFLPNGTKYERAMETHPVDLLKRGMSYLSGATMPSPLLAKDWSKYTKCHYLPNYLDGNVYNIPRGKTGKIILGWGGSMSHLTSWSGSGIDKALANIVNKRNDVKLLIVGDKRVVKQISGIIDPAKTEYLPYVTYMDWPMVLAKKFDIGLAPLAGPYDCRRSRLKVMEYIATGIPFVATRAMPYFELYDEIDNSFVPQGDVTKADEPNAQEWEQLLNDKINNFHNEQELAIERKKEWEQWYDVNRNISEIIGKYNLV